MEGSGGQPWGSRGQGERWEDEGELQAGAVLWLLPQVPSANPSSGQTPVGEGSGVQLSTPLCKPGGGSHLCQQWGLAAQSR